ncbi:MAG TPA: ABC transporter permease subunit/CPBP intramembrane protease [Pirellulales bacterium]|nr:ABC transporter permease subunit/CPBP intramembrane protease [Pirellulales bacterium]
MNWSNVKLILHREVRDQLRDRRTLFMIAVLPLLLYPLLGMSMFQVLQFVREHATHVLVIGADELPDEPKLIEGDHFAERWFSSASKVRLLQLAFVKGEAAARSADEVFADARRSVAQGEYEAVVYFPPGFGRQLQEFRASLSGNRAAAPDGEQPKLAVPSPEVYYNTAKEKSQITFIRIEQVISRWTEAIGKQNLAESHLPETAARPFELAEHDVAVEHGHRDAAVWSKLLPFLLLIWALTGAFYPAIDLCAGEKERGTLETLLSSPAERSEIVWGKLLTIMLFSMVSALLNLASMGVTGSLIVRALPNEIGPPPALTPLWLVLALVPMSALFSALCLALASFARSSKEGQYYLMPLMLITMPLVLLPMAPGVELTLGNSLIPVTGVVLLLRALVEGNLLEALPYVPVVVMVTLACCLWSIRWAVDQFNSESVLFRESERLDLGLWLRHLVRDRGDTPSPAEALFCGLLILMIRFFLGLVMDQTPPNTFPTWAKLILITQLTTVLTPALLMTIMLTRSSRKTLLLRLPPLGSVPAAVLLAIVLHPAVTQLSIIVQRIYPVSETMREAMKLPFDIDTPLWQLMAVLALTPAVCEELAFRGFMLSGLRHLGHKWQSILISSIFFGIVHGMLQQSIVACIMGLVIGYLAVQTGSLLPAIVYHLTTNSLPLLVGQWIEQPAFRPAAWSWLLVRQEEVPYLFTWPATALGGLVAAGLLYWFHRLPYARTAEETLQAALERQRAPAA